MVAFFDVPVNYAGLEYDKYDALTLTFRKINKIPFFSFIYLSILTRAIEYSSIKVTGSRGGILNDNLVGLEIAGWASTNWSTLYYIYLKLTHSTI